MGEHDYPGIRYTLNAMLGNMQEIVKIDMSAGDLITPGAVEFSFRLMFEERCITLWAYNLETLLGEKLETMMARGTANTRMRDFYDAFVLYRQKRESIKRDILFAAFYATSERRKTVDLTPELQRILGEVRESQEMRDNWERYKRNNHYVEDLPWDDVMKAIIELVCWMQRE